MTRTVIVNARRPSEIDRDSKRASLRLQPHFTARQYTFITDAISEISPDIRRTVAEHFANALTKVPSWEFDRAGFVDACK